MKVAAAAIVDSRNLFHQAGDAIGARVRPTVPGVKAALAEYGFDVRQVHIGLALARPADQAVLARQHAENEAYRGQVELDGGDVLLGELHRKDGGQVEEKMVDGACCVRITRYVDEIRSGSSQVDAVVVLSKDIDLTPAVDYAVEMKVPITVAALDVVQHRKHPFALLGPRAYHLITGGDPSLTGHEYRELVVCALADGKALTWTVRGPRDRPRLQHQCGIIGVAASGVTLPGPGQEVLLHPVDVTWDDRVLGSFPLLVCGPQPASTRAWSSAVVRRRTAPMSIEVELKTGAKKRKHFPLGGVVPGDKVAVQHETGRVIGRLVDGAPDRTFDPDRPRPVRIISALPRGGALAVDDQGRRGLLNTDQKLIAGQHVPALLIDSNQRGLVWSAIGSPLP